MNDDQVEMYFQQVWSDLDPSKEFWKVKPLLAHYTSIAVMEQILKHDQIWLSNPLYMNDHEEVRFGIENASAFVRADTSVLSAVLRTPQRRLLFLQHFEQLLGKFYEDVLDTYVFCWCQHDPTDNDGLLSMWRGYGSNGDGVALVMDASKLGVNEISPFSLAKVEYGTQVERLQYLNEKIFNRFIALLNGQHVEDSQLPIAAFHLFERVKMFALYTKHCGFKEENEWRLVYWRSRDTKNQLGSMLSYFAGPKGLEPKLKLDVRQIPGITVPPDFSISKITDRIILGPTVSSPLSRSAMMKLLDSVKKPELRERVFTSGIPFRSRY